MLKKILFLSIIIYSIQTSLNVLSDLPKQSLFFSSSEKAKIDLNGFSFKSSYDTNMVIQKYEKENILPSKNTMSVYVNSLYNKNLICLDISQDNFYTLKNKLTKHVSTFYYKNSDSYTEISDKEHYCQERLEFIGKDLNLHEKNSLLDKNYFYNLVNNKENIQRNRIQHPHLQNLTDISFEDIHLEIVKLVNSEYKWNDDWSYELFFVYNIKDDTFHLSKVFIYYYGKDSIKIKVVLNSYEEIQMLLKESNKVVKYSNKKYTIDSMNLNDYLLNYNIKIKTNKSTSVYHNAMEIQLSEDLINNMYTKYKMNKEQKLCYLIHEVLTEDVYIEKNEFKNLLNEYLEQYGIKIDYELHASRFIEQELSSDLSQQSYFSLYFCANYSQMKAINYNIKYSMHFRYQPSLKKESLLTHQTVVMPHPFLTIYKDSSLDSYTSNFFNTLLYRGNVLKGKFSDEVDIKLNTIFNEVHMLKNNYEQLKHQIPAGQMKFFWPIAVVTSVTSLIGFVIILRGITQYTISKASIIQKNKKTQ